MAPDAHPDFIKVFRGDQSLLDILSKRTAKTALPLACALEAFTTFEVFGDPGGNNPSGVFGQP